MAVKEKKDIKKKEKVNKPVEKKVEKKAEKKTVANNNSGIKAWFKGVKSEFKKVRWPDKKEMVKYSIATIAFILFFALFFYVIEVAIYFINQVK